MRLHPSVPAAKRSARFPRDGFTLFLAAVSVVGAALVLARSATYGVEMFWDSVVYISTARSLLSGEGFVTFQGQLHQFWPPLYSMLLAGAGAVGLDPRDVAAPLNAAVFGVNVFVVGRWLRPRLQSRFLLAWGCLAVALSVPLTNIASWALSETTFILFATLSLFETDRFLNDSRSSSLVRAAAFTAIACLTRYVGVVLLATFVLLALVRRGAAPLERMKQAAVYTAIAAAPVGLWLLRNLLLVGDVAGSRRLRPTPLPETLETVVSVLAGWTVPRLPANSLLSGDGLVAVSAAGLALLVAALTARFLVTHRGCAVAPGAGSRTALRVLGTFALAHVVLCVVSLLTVELPTGAPRHMLPAYLPLLLAGVLALDRFLAYEGKSTKMATGSAAAPAGPTTTTLPARALTAALCAWLLYGAGLNALEIWRANHGLDRALSGPAFASSEILRYVREHAPDGPILSNQIDGVYIHTDGSGTYRDLCAGLERRRPTGRQRCRGVRPQVADAPEGTHLVWLHGAFAKARYGYDVADLRVLPRMRTVAELSDGVVFRVDDSAASDLGAYRSAYETVVSGELVLRAGFDVYLQNGTLTWIKKPCSRADTEPLFHLYATPVDADDLAESQREYGFAVLDFYFDREGGVRFDETCMVQRALPAYPVSSIATGQWTPADGVLWMGDFPVPAR